MTRLDRRLDRKANELSGEKFAREYVEREHREPANEHDLKRYLKSRNMLITRKKNQNGIIGVSYKSVDRTMYGVTLPGNDIKLLNFRNPIQAAIFYNLWVKERFGEHAILCDVRAVLRKHLHHQVKAQFLV